MNKKRKIKSNYRLLHAPKKRYLPPDVTVTFLYDDHSSKMPEKISYDKYRKVFLTQNIGSNIPSQDECPICSKFKQHKAELLNISTATSVSTMTTITSYDVVHQ